MKIQRYRNTDWGSLYNVNDPDDESYLGADDSLVKLSDVLALLDVYVDYAAPRYDPYDSVGKERARLRAALGAE